MMRMRQVSAFVPGVAVMLATLPTAAAQPRFAPAAPNTPHRGSFPVVEVVSSRPGAGARVSTSVAIPVPRNAGKRGAGDVAARVEREEAAAERRWAGGDGAPPWRLDTGAAIEHAYPIRQRFDGWAYGRYWNTVTRRWERGWHTTRFGLDPDYYR